MTQNNNISCLPWYRNIEEQNHRKSYAYGQIYPLYTPLNSLLPFQLMRPTRDADITSVELYDINGNYVADLTAAMEYTGLSIQKFPEYGYDVIVYNSLAHFVTLDMEEGRYYAKMSDGVDVWYSEVFTAVANMSGFLSVEWYDKEDLLFDAGRIVYSNGFRNRLYFCTELGRPEYTFEEEGSTRDGYFFAEKQISEKTYRCTILAPEYLCDVMRFIRMSDFVVVTDQYKRQYICDTFLITPKWQPQGYIASVEIEFDTDTVVKKIGRGFVGPIEGDFNEDYNKDFFNYGTDNRPN